MRRDDPDLDDLDDDWTLEDDSDSSDVVPCPECGAEVYEDAEQCPACGQYIILSTSPWRGRPLWWILLGLAGFAAVLWLSLPGPVSSGGPPLVPVQRRGDR
ncbi:MAG TPA: zinc-ribbon domain-containing protein [Isosphaeraceae bacterium]